MANIPQLLIHNRRDNVGVVVVEDLSAGTDMLCVVTEDNSEIRARSNHDVPIGHKIALADLAVGDTVVKYGEDIGKVVAAIRKGDRPLLTAGGQRQPGRGIHLDHVRRSASSVPRALDRLDCAKRRNAHLDRVARRPLGEELQQIANRGRGRLAVGRSLERGAHTGVPKLIRDSRPGHENTLDERR